MERVYDKISFYLFGGKTKTELIELIEEVFTKVSMPLNVVASFGNGETIYAKA